MAAVVLNLQVGYTQCARKCRDIQKLNGFSNRHSKPSSNRLSAMLRGKANMVGICRSSMALLSLLLLDYETEVSKFLPAWHVMAEAITPSLVALQLRNQWLHCLQAN